MSDRPKTPPLARVPHRDYTRTPATPVRGVPEFMPEDPTGNYEGEALAQIRARRPTDKRLARLEDKHDSLDSKVDAMHGEVREMRGELKVLPRLIEVIEKSVERNAQREHVTFTAKVDVDKAQQIDTIDKAKSWRDWIGKALSIAAAVVALATAAFAAGRC